MAIRTFEKRRGIARGTAMLLSVLLLGTGNLALAAAQESTPEPAQGAAVQTAPKLSNDQLDSLVAPIALYPDPLLSQALVASTYPLEIIQASQWMAKNSSLKGEALEKAALEQNWDPSIQAMVALPDMIKRLTEDITWTTNLGNAFLAQQDDVMASVQRLRLKAKEAGKLESSEQQKVETKVVESKTIVVIEPASTQVVYVPTYSPTVIWGPPVYPYPPVYYPPGAGLVTFGMGMAMGAAISNGGWGWNTGWGGGNNNITINNNNNYVNHNNVKNNVNSGNRSNSNWNHNASHRGGAPYADKSTASKYGGSARGDSASARQNQARTGGGASSRQSQPRASSTQAQSRGGSGANTSANRGGGGGNYAGNRSMPSSSSRGGGGGSAFSGASGGASSANRARASSSRGASSMSRGGGGGRRR